MSDFYFNVNDPEIQNDFNPLPKGSYNCTLEKVEDRTDSKGKKYVYCSFTVIEGEYKGRKIIDLLYVYKNPTNNDYEEEKDKKRRWYGKTAMRQMLEAHGLIEIYSLSELAGRNYQIVIDSYIKDGVEKESRRYGKVPAVDITGSPWQ